MKNLIHILLILLLCYQTQAQWHQVNSNTTEDISQMVFMNPDKGFFVSGNSIYITTDAGENWNSIFTQNNLEFNSIGITNNKIYAFAKQNGTDKLLQSSDEGITWYVSDTIYYPKDVISKTGKLFFIDWNDNLKLKEIQENQINILADNSSILYGINQNEIVTVNSTYTNIYKSIDKGHTWSVLSNFPNNFNGNNANWSQIKSFGDTIVLTASYEAKIYLSTDNGNTWDIIYDENIPTPNIILNSGFIYGMSTCNQEGEFFPCITTSSDYGNTWEVIQTNFLGSGHRFYFYNNNLGFAYTKEGIIYKTSN